MLLTYATYNSIVQYNVISPVELKFTIVTLLKKLKHKLKLKLIHSPNKEILFIK